MNFFKAIFSQKRHEEYPLYGSIELKEGDTFFSFTQSVNMKVIHSLSNSLKEKLNSSNLAVIHSPIYSHYWNESLIYKGPDNQNWQNHFVFFWNAEESFSRKSLPPIFDTYISKRFLFVLNKRIVSLHHGKVMPWFGMPGMGEKYFCEIANEKVTVPDLKTLGVVQYIEPVVLTAENVDILKDPDQYLFLVDEKTVQFKNSSFYVQDKPVSNAVAYAIGGIQIFKKIQ